MPPKSSKSQGNNFINFFFDTDDDKGQECRCLPMDHLHAYYIAIQGPCGFQTDVYKTCSDTLPARIVDSSYPVSPGVGPGDGTIAVIDKVQEQIVDIVDVNEHVTRMAGEAACCGLCSHPNAP